MRIRKLYAMTDAFAPGMDFDTFRALALRAWNRARRNMASAQRSAPTQQVQYETHYHLIRSCKRWAQDRRPAA